MSSITLLEKEMIYNIPTYFVPFYSITRKDRENWGYSSQPLDKET